MVVGRRDERAHAVRCRLTIESRSRSLPRVGEVCPEGRRGGGGIFSTAPFLSLEFEC